MPTPYQPPAPYVGRLDTIEHDSYQERAQLALELLEAVNADERPAVLAAVLKLAASHAVETHRNSRVWLDALQDAHDDGLATGEQMAAAALLSVEPAIMH